jgi:hypothetical protein
MAAFTYRLPRKYRYRSYGKSGSAGPVIAVTVAVVLAAATGTRAAAAHHGSRAAAAHHGSSSGHATEAQAAIPSGSSLNTPSGWAAALLAADSLPRTACNLSAIREWEAREGGGFGNQAAYNPLNVNPGAGADWPGRNVIGAWAFPDAQTGLRYTVATLNNGYYSGILAALRRGASAQAVCNAIMASPWAASRYGGTLTATC